MATIMMTMKTIKGEKGKDNKRQNRKEDRKDEGTSNAPKKIVRPFLFVVFNKAKKLK